MRAVVQRVTRASVRVEGELVGAIERGLCVFVGVGQDDVSADATALAEKVLGLRIFADDEGKMNRSVLDVSGGLLLVSQFTLFGDVRKGKRPSFTAAMLPEPARLLFESFVGACRASGLSVATGRFQADMAVSIVNDGPVTILLDTKRLF